jgi:hypothetical protein
MFRMRLMLPLTLTTIVFLSCWHPSPSSAQSPGSGGPGVASLRDQLNSGLRARRPEEFAFIAQVAQLVEMNQLPRDLVTAIFKWAKKSKQPYPFPYFQRAMQEKAAERGIAL